MSDNLWAVDMEHGLLRSSKFGLSCADVRARWAGGVVCGGFCVSPASRSFKVAQRLERFWAVQWLIILGTVKTSAPENQTAPDLFFSTGCLPPPPFVFFYFSLFFFPSLSLSFFSPSNWGESFQNSNYPPSLVNLSQFSKPWGCEVADLGRWVNQHPGWNHGKTTKFI